MGTVNRSTKSGSGTTNFDPNTVAKASEVNADLNTIYSEFNGNVDNNNVKAGAGIASSKLDLTTISQNINQTGSFETDSFKLTTATTVTSILDEDNMASDSAAALATQQSIKAYVDGKALSSFSTTGGGNGEVFVADGANGGSWGSAGNSQLFTSSGTFTAPSGVNFVFISGVGGGGGGADSGNEGGGGGSGAFIVKAGVNVTAGNNYTVTIGAGGAKGTLNADGSAGGNTSFVGDDVTITLNGGSGGLHIGTGGSGGAAAGSYDGSGRTGGGYTTTAGGDGADESGGSGGGGGGNPFGKGGTGALTSVSDATEPVGYGAGGGGGGNPGQDSSAGAGGMLYIEW